MSGLGRTSTESGYQILGADLIEKDSSTRDVKGNYKDGQLQTMILCIQDRFTRRLWTTPLPGKSNEDVLAGMRRLIPQIHGPGVMRGRREGPRELVTDSASYFKSAEFQGYLQSVGLIHRLKNSKLRPELQNNSVVDAAIGKLQGILQARRGEDPA